MLLRKVGSLKKGQEFVRSEDSLEIFKVTETAKEKTNWQVMAFCRETNERLSLDKGEEVWLTTNPDRKKIKLARAEKEKNNGQT